MKRIILAFAAFFSLFSAFSLTKEEVLESLSKQTEKKGNFTQTKTISKLNRNLKSSGTYFFSPEEITWNTEKPFPSKLTITEKEMIQISPNGSKQTVDFSKNPTFSSIASAIKSIFNNNSKILEKNFDIVFTEIKNENGGNKTNEVQLWSILLSPKDSTIKSAIKNINVKGETKKTSENTASEKNSEKPEFGKSSEKTYGTSTSEKTSENKAVESFTEKYISEILSMEISEASGDFISYEFN